MRHLISTAMMCAAAGVAEAMAGQPAIPSPQQLHTLDLGIISIVHFGLNTFTDKEWGFGDTSPAVFNPVKFDASQWASAAKAGGIRRMVMVCKHHDGFCLWPSPLNSDYTVANTPWKDGKGDIVREVHDAAQAAGIEFAAYLSPWDRHQAEYARPAYVEYFHGQWNDLLDHYGPICEVWLDGANGGDGWYGGHPEKRVLPKPAYQYYEYDRLLQTVYAKSAGAVIFGGGGPRGMCWPGNEKGFVPEGYDYGATAGSYRPPECDTPLRMKWFWHKDDAAKSLRELVNRYFESVGRGGILNLGLSPNDQGLLDEGDVKRLQEFGDYVRAFNAVDYAAGASCTVTRQGAETVYAYTLTAPVTFDAVDFREDLTKGMRIRGWRLEASGKTLAEGTWAGFRRMARFAPVTAAEVKLVITACDGSEPAVCGFALRHAPDPVTGEVPEKVNCVAKECYRVTEEGGRNVTVDFWGVIALSGFEYTPQESGPQGMADRYSVWRSNNGRDWQAVCEGEFGNLRANPVTQNVRFAQKVTARYLRVVAERALEGEPKWKAAQLRFVK